MQIHRLRLSNFRQHEHTDIEFGAGLTGIIGPNGAGKTTLLEAIAWVMYGMKAARGSRETIRRRGAPPRSRVEVELEFTLGAHHYRVVRGLGWAELYQDGGTTPVANSLDAVTERITRLLGMSRDEFFNTYFTGQKELAVMASMSAPERAQFLSRVLGYEKLRSAQERLKEQRTALRARIAGLQASLPDPAELDAEEDRARARGRAAETAEADAAQAAQAAEARAAVVRPRWEAVEQARERSLALEADRRVAAAQFDALAANLGRLRQQAADAEVARRRLAEITPAIAGLESLRADVAMFDRQAEAFHARQAAVAQLGEVRGRIAEIEARLPALPADGAAIRAAEQVSELRARLTALALEIDERRTAWVRDRQDAETKRQALLDQYRELKDHRQRVMDAGPDGACPTCARALGGEFENVLGVLDRQLEAVTENGNYYRQRRAQLEAQPGELEAAESKQVQVEQALSEAVAAEGRIAAQLAERRGLAAERDRLAERAAGLERTAGVDAVAYDQTRHQAVRDETARLAPLALEAERLGVAAARAPALAQEVAALETDAAGMAGRLADLVAAIAALGFSEPMHQTLLGELQGVERDLRAAEVALVRARSERQAASESLEALLKRRADVVRRRQEVAAAAGELALLQELDRALTDLRTDLNQALRPELSEVASAFVRDLTNARYTELELDENYMATLLDEGDPKAVISGGEEDIANLALRLAISQMIAERAGQPLSLLVLDEIFGSLDEERRTSVVELLRSLADRFPQVILITHVDTVRDGFDRVIRVECDLSTNVAVVRDEAPGGHDAAA